MALSTFSYTALESDSQIRILSILPKARSKEVECNLVHASHIEDLTYNALSYTWGNALTTSMVKVNGQLFTATESLTTALQHLREETETAKFWIDAICINQKDTNEKNGQVKRMKEIYENAAKVIVWLGPECDDSGYALKSVNDFYRCWAKRNLQSANEQYTAAQALDGRAHQAINRLLRRPWWRRAWIIQEATCAKPTYLRCGKDETDFRAVAATVNFIVEAETRKALQHFSKPDITHLHRVIALRGIRVNRQSCTHGLDFLDLLDNARTCEASDPRDKLFALSGLAIKAQRGAGTPDYSMPVDETYMSFAHAFMKADQTLNILGHCQASVKNLQAWLSSRSLPSRLLPKRPLPSWTPDWTMHLEATPFMKNEIPNDTSSNKVYRASGHYTPSLQLSKEVQTLYVRGFVFDTVLRLGEHFTRILEPSTISMWHTWAALELGNMYLTGESTHEAFLHTIVADVGIKEKRCKRHFAASWPLHNVNNAKDSFAENSCLNFALNSRGFFRSLKGYMGLARYDVMEGDLICILHGGQVPFIVRRDRECYVFKGECYIHGLMDGEGMMYPVIWQDFGLR